MTLDSSMLFRPGEQALVEPLARAREHARELVGQLVGRGLRASDAPNIGTPAGVMTVSAQRVDVHPYVGRLVVLLPGPGGSGGLFWHWQRPYAGRRWIGARWFQAFCPATEPDRAADAIVAAIDADVQARSRSAHIPAAQAGGDAEFERELLTRAGRPLHLLVYRILALLDSVEKEVEDTVLLHELFKIDHLTTRTLRGLERLAVLGGRTARQVNAPLKLATVMRQAVAQIEHYRRVRVQVPPPEVEADLPGYAGPEITLLLAELVENATAFSGTQVQMAAVPAPSGVNIEITDHGRLPMSADTYTALNRVLADPGTVSLREQIVAGPIGLLVASRLAQRHGVQVTLHPAEPEGTRAVVALPATLLMASRPPAPRPPAPQLQAPRPPARRPDTSTAAPPSRRATPPLLPSPASPPAPTAGPAGAEAPSGSGGDQGWPALPRRRRARSTDSAQPDGPRDADRDRQAGPAQPREHGHEQHNGSMRRPVPGLLADFAGAARPHTRTEDPAGQGPSTSPRSAAQPINPPADPPAEQSAD